MERIGLTQKLIAFVNRGDILDRQRIDSSSIKSVGYDPDAEILEIEFRNGGVYQYLDVPKRVYEDVINASSAGRYHTVYIKDEFRFRRIK